MIVVAVIAIDMRVRARFGTLFGGAVWVDRLRYVANTVGDIISMTMRDHRLDNAVLLLFIVVALGLVLFMLRT